jgi:hypothetical protein
VVINIAWRQLQRNALSEMLLMILANLNGATSAVATIFPRDYEVDQKDPLKESRRLRLTMEPAEKGGHE